MDPRRNQKRNKNNFEINENGNTTYLNLWDAAKVVLRENFIVINTTSRNKEDHK